MEAMHEWNRRGGMLVSVIKCKNKLSFFILSTLPVKSIKGEIIKIFLMFLKDLTNALFDEKYSKTVILWNIIPI